MATTIVSIFLMIILRLLIQSGSHKIVPNGVDWFFTQWRGVLSSNRWSSDSKEAAKRGGLLRAQGNLALVFVFDFFFGRVPHLPARLLTSFHALVCTGRSGTGCRRRARPWCIGTRTACTCASAACTCASRGMVAVRRHHVFVLEAHLGGRTWQVYDANSGGRLTRFHARSIAGYVIVNPKA